MPGRGYLDLVNWVGKKDPPTVDDTIFWDGMWIIWKGKTDKQAFTCSMFWLLDVCPTALRLCSQDFPAVTDWTRKLWALPNPFSLLLSGSIIIKGKATNPATIFALMSLQPLCPLPVRWDPHLGSEVPSAGRGDVSGRSWREWGEKAAVWKAARPCSLQYIATPSPASDIISKPCLILNLSFFAAPGRTG